MCEGTLEPNTRETIRNTDWQIQKKVIGKFVRTNYAYKDYIESAANEGLYLICLKMDEKNLNGSERNAYLYSALCKKIIDELQNIHLIKISKALKEKPYIYASMPEQQYQDNNYVAVNILLESIPMEDSKIIRYLIHGYTQREIANMMSMPLTKINLKIKEIRSYIKTLI